MFHLVLEDDGQPALSLQPSSGLVGSQTDRQTDRQAGKEHEPSQALRLVIHMSLHMSTDKISVSPVPDRILAAR